MVSAAEPHAGTGGPGESTLTPSGADGLTHLVFGLAPAEDSGSDTLGRYRYQAEVAARECLAMLTEENIDFIVCEWHEDFVVAFADGSVELVSVKHREESQGPWTVTELCKTGGLAHLFDRWCACECAPNVRLRLATNAAMKPSKNNADTLARMCGPKPELTSGLTDMVKTVAHQMLKIRWKQEYLNIPLTPEVKLADIQPPAGFVEKVRRFLAVLEISCAPPQRRYITDVNIQRLLAPAVKSLELVDVDLEATYRAIVNRIEQANRDEEDRSQLAVYIADPARVRYNTQLQQRISRRRLTRTIIYEEFEYTTVQPPTVPRGQIPVVAPGGTRLRRKLSRGHVPSDEAEFAESLRSAWFTTWSGRRSGLVGDETDLMNLSFDVLDTAFKCRRHARSEVNDGSAFGTEMNELLADRLTVDALSSTPPFPLNDLHLRGLAYQLCDECRFYFSEPFDTDEEAS
ncbi:dsDNA nuclease domain-containing protein [Rhodococcus opacus]|uniref:dsDNA nuclease domain-containing protein n=1 Tax=Rhodococcus opacus TaxID=37919 RepID=UPI002954FA1B|nr:dsDNA nuclease domain-containing protein [Rhodococcus opacus]MDV7091079.1 dsDNA nuclease domain-containing protein [Rhodococcus opacus]